MLNYNGTSIELHITSTQVSREKLD